MTNWKIGMKCVYVGNGNPANPVCIEPEIDEIVTIDGFHPSYPDYVGLKEYPEDLFGKRQLCSKSRLRPLGSIRLHSTSTISNLSTIKRLVSLPLVEEKIEQRKETVKQ